MIHLFHGTNEVFDAIDPLKGRRGTDFVGPTVSCD